MNDLVAFDVGKIEGVKFFSTFRDVLVRNPNLHEFVFEVLLNCSFFLLAGSWVHQCLVVELIETSTLTSLKHQYSLQPPTGRWCFS